MKAHERIVFALDVPRVEEAIALVDRLKDHVGYFKVGLELFISAWGDARFSSGASNARAMSDGATLLENIPKGKLILDLKLHDIPETVERAIGAAAQYRPAFITIHVQQRATLERAVRIAGKEGVKLLGVTVLTSINDIDLCDLRSADIVPGIRVKKMAQLAWHCGIGGFVCSPKEVSMLRHEFTGEPGNWGPLFLMVPGIRLLTEEQKKLDSTLDLEHIQAMTEAEARQRRPSFRVYEDLYDGKTEKIIKKDSDDQQRIGTPSQAIRDGADLLVIGRPIRDAADPVAAAQAIAQEIKEASSK